MSARLSNAFSLLGRPGQTLRPAKQISCPPTCMLTELCRHGIATVDLKCAPACSLQNFVSGAAVYHIQLFPSTVPSGVAAMLKRFFIPLCLFTLLSGFASAQN